MKKIIDATETKGEANTRQKKAKIAKTAKKMRKIAKKISESLG